MFGRIIRNLLTNALKFTDQGGVRVLLSQKGNNVMVTVADTGIGIAPADQERIFDEYHQVSNKARKREEGIGLGLSVVKKICELLGHEIRLESVPGEGSRFTLMLPAGDRKQLVNGRNESTETDISGLSVLVIDDDAGVLEAVSLLLKDWGCEVSVAACVSDAIEQLEPGQITPDLVLSDYRLDEEGTGIDAIEAVRSRLSQPVSGLLMSGDTDPELINDIRRRGYHLLRKPVKPVHLHKVMRQLMDG
ncbi:MAG: ATP-binding protein [Ketobacteraceae bacterium]|nr:ATP-binding protein [Ketobacteraceae bacterium]